MGRRTNALFMRLGVPRRGMRNCCKERIDLLMVPDIIRWTTRLLSRYLQPKAQDARFENEGFTSATLTVAHRTQIPRSTELGM